MDELLRELSLFPDETAAPTVIVVLASTLLSFLCSLLVVHTYRETHSGPSYSQASAHTLVIMAVVTSVIMLIIGSNIARAFSLVGALSVIRFRSAVKDPRDVAFLYFSMAIGMAAGTRFFAIAVALTLVVCGMVHVLSRLNIGAKPFDQFLLKLLVAREGQDREGLEKLLVDHLKAYTLLAVEAVSSDQIELSYSVSLGSGKDAPLLQALQAHEGVQQVSLYPGLSDEAVA
jgi:uncharacterized membrane protein YhiD involved in acid resistance